MAAVIVCGSRDWDDWQAVSDVLGALDIRHLIHGACPTGADMMADSWSKWLSNVIELETYPADWGKNGNAAGPIRNSEMIGRLLELPEPRYVIAFRKGLKSNGTDDMIRKARAAGVDTVVYYRA